MSSTYRVSPGVTSREIDLTGPTTTGPRGVPAGVIGTSQMGPAFVPITVANISELENRFGAFDRTEFGILAAREWLSNAQALTYLRVLGVGTGEMSMVNDNDSPGSGAGRVKYAGFVVGNKLPGAALGGTSWGDLVGNPYASGSGPGGRTYFLGAFMGADVNVASVGDQLFTSGVLAGTAPQPFIVGVLMAPSGVVLTLSSTYGGGNSDVASSNAYLPSGSSVGDVVLKSPASTMSGMSQFVMLLNGHATGTTAITASLSRNSNSYFGSTFNTVPTKMQEAGHYLYAAWDYPGLSVTGSSLMSGSVTSSYSNPKYVEPIVFLLTGSNDQNHVSATSPNYENFETRFGHAVTPMVVSQRIGGKPTDLFRLHALSDGAGVAKNYKFSIENITPSPDPAYLYGTFDLLVRSWNDTDFEKTVYEKYTGLSLDPTNDRYIAKAIGDVNTYYDFERDTNSQKLVVEGDYNNNSSIVRVEVSDDVSLGLAAAECLPMGFRGLPHLVTSGSALKVDGLDLAVTGSGVSSFSSLLKSARQAPVPYVLSIYKGLSTKRTADPNRYWGVAFDLPVLTNDTGVQLGRHKNQFVSDFTKFFPQFIVGNPNFVVGDNAGVADDVNFGVVDADRFNNNLFTLENIAVVTSSKTPHMADPNAWQNAEYMRNGIKPADDRRMLTVSDLTTDNKGYAKFTFVMQGGFDGVNLFDEHSAAIDGVAVECDMRQPLRHDVNGANVKAYTKALDVMKNVTNVDIQLLAMPGIRNTYVTDRALAAVESRFDAMYLMDVEAYDQGDNLLLPGTENFMDNGLPVEKVDVSYTAQNFADRGINSSFGAAYFPDLRYVHPSTAAEVQVPPTVAVLGALSLNDKLGHPWFAPAGYTRGVLPNVTDPTVPLTDADMDRLYDRDVNMVIKKAAPAGTVVWGQKTLLKAASALDRVNVRRLLIEVRRQVRDIAQTILFEPNRAATLARFSAAITPRLQTIQQQAGLDRFKVIIDSSTTTQADIENNTVRGKIYLQPTKSVEFVSLDFVVTNNIQQ